MTPENFTRITESHALMRGCYANARERLRWARTSLVLGRAESAVRDLLSADYWRACAREWRRERDRTIELERVAS